VGNFKLDLEIDGRQHTYRVEHDKERDAFLRENGFLVYRIPWNTVNTENGRQLMKEKIDKFLEFYNSLKE
jgi:very-short-patch-repair endonuclease